MFLSKLYFFLDERFFGFVVAVVARAYALVGALSDDEDDDAINTTKNINNNRSQPAQASVAPVKATINNDRVVDAARAGSVAAAAAVAPSVAPVAATSDRVRAALDVLAELDNDDDDDNDDDNDDAEKQVVMANEAPLWQDDDQSSSHFAVSSHFFMLNIYCDYFYIN